MTGCTLRFYEVSEDLCCSDSMAFLGIFSPYFRVGHMAYQVPGDGSLASTSQLVGPMRYARNYGQDGMLDMRKPVP